MPDRISGLRAPTEKAGVTMEQFTKMTLRQAIAYRVLDWEESNPPSFYALAFIVSYQVRTLFTELRATARL